MTKIVDLPSATSVTGNDLVPIYQGGTTKKLSATLLSGPVGPTGPQGPIGPTGPTGPSGITKPVREQLTSSRTYYVRTDGNDSNTGLSNSPTGAFLTLQKAEDVASSFDNGGYDITIQVANGTYTTNLVLKSFVGSGSIRYVGNATTPGSVILQSTSGVIINSSSVPGSHYFSGFTLSGTNCIGAVSGSKSILNLDNIKLLPLIYGLFAIDSGILTCGKLEIAGNMNNCLLAANQGSVQLSPGSTITLTGTPNFSSSFVGVDRGSVATVYGLTFSGSATGVRYTIASNAIVFVNSAGANYLPGNAAGTITTGGQYT